MIRSAHKSTYLMLLASLAVLSSTALQARTPDPQEVLYNWAKARGGRSSIDRIITLDTEARITLYGMEGTVRQKMSRPSRYLMQLDLGGVFGLTHLSRDGQTWIRDQDGNVSEVAGKDRADILSSAHLENLQHLRTGAPDSLITAVAKEAGTGLLAVTLTIPGAAEAVFYLDPESWLPVRSESKATGGGVTTVHYSAWQPVQGVLFAHEIRQTDGDPRNDMNLTLTGVDINPDRSEDPFASLGGETAPSAIVDSDLASRIPVQLRGVHIYVDVTINDQGPFQFVYDSGAGITVIDKGLADSLQLEQQGSIAGGGVGENKVEIGLAPGVTVGMPGVRVVDQTLGVLDIQGVLEERIGAKVDGIVGFGFISRFVTEIDYAQSRIGLHDPATFAYEGSGVVVPMVTDGATPHVEALVRGYGGEAVTGYFKLDTGSGGAISLSGPFASRHGIVATMPRKAIHNGGFGVGGSTTSTIGRLQSIEIGGVVFDEPVASVSHDDGGAGADENIAGLIGGRLMSRCRTFLDYAGKRLILEPYPHLGDRFHWNKSGLTLVTGGRGDYHNFSIASIVPDSPGQDAGLRTGDRLLAIDGRAAAEWEAHQLAEMFRGVDRDLEIVLLREGEEKQVILKLREFI